MKLLHTSDWHLGKSEGETSLIEDQLFFIDQICDLVRSEKIDAILLAGDVYDRALAAAEAVRLYDYAMQKLCMDCGVKVFIIAGNHDSAERLQSCRTLLSQAGLYIRGELDKDLGYEVLGDCQIFLLPWISEEKVRSVFPEEKEKIVDLESAYRVVIDNLHSQFVPDKKHLILSHAYVTGAETSTSDRAAEIGSASLIPASVFDGFDYVALGHIHGPQIISPTVRYCGTPMPYSFGKEEKQRKGVVILDTETMTQEFCELPLLHRRSSLEGSLADILTGEYSDDVRGGYVRISISDMVLTLPVLARLKEIFSLILIYEGMSFDGGDSSIKLTLQQLEEAKNDPIEVLKYFCRDEMDIDLDLPENAHYLDLFREAVLESEKEDDL